MDKEAQCRTEMTADTERRAQTAHTTKRVVIQLDHKSSGPSKATLSQRPWTSSAIPSATKRLRHTHTFRVSTPSPSISQRNKVPSHLSRATRNRNVVAKHTERADARAKSAPGREYTHSIYQTQKDIHRTMTPDPALLAALEEEQEKYERYNREGRRWKKFEEHLRSINDGPMRFGAAQKNSRSSQEFKQVKARMDTLHRKARSVVSIVRLKRVGGEHREKRDRILSRSTSLSGHTYSDDDLSEFGSVEGRELERKKMIRLRARDGWQRLRAGVLEFQARIREQRRQQWIFLGRHMKTIMNMEQARQDLYERYGYYGLKPGARPRHNPMKLASFSADEISKLPEFGIGSTVEKSDEKKMYRRKEHVSDKQNLQQANVKRSIAVNQIQSNNEGHARNGGKTEVGREQLSSAKKKRPPRSAGTLRFAQENASDSVFEDDKETLS